ncbi:MAG TPA: ATP-binding cassette domain-containing protein [Candidatus Dormibacteraeota bacterium]|nr:ATP-binding cassette domain-containing protein [Candidatus Dormibacteraeota bacterium]
MAEMRRRLDELRRPSGPQQRAQRALYAAAGVGLVGLLVLPLLQDQLQVNDFLFFFITASMITILVTTALNLCMGYTGLLSIVHTGLFGVGAYATGILATQAHVNTWLSMLLGVVAATSAGVVIAAVSLRARALYFGMITLTFDLIIAGVATNGGRLTGADTGLFGVPQPQLAGNDLGTRGFYYLTLALTVLTLLAVRNLMRSRTGRSFMAIRESADTAAALGIPAYSTQILAFAVSATIAGAAGAVYVTLNGFVTPQSADLSGALILFIGVLLGGTATVIGPVLGIGVIATIQHYMEVTAPNYQQLIFGAVLLAAMMLVPAGIVGTWKRSRLGSLEEPEPPSSPIGNLVEALPAERGPALRLTGIVKRFGGVLALDRVDLEVVTGSIHGLIGPNGSGKSTLVSVATAFLRPDEGSVELFGEPGPRRPHLTARRGMVRVFQSPHIFERLTVLENAMVGLHLESRQRLPASVLRMPSFERDERRLRGLALSRLEEVGLRQIAMRPASVLSHGQKRLLEVARSLGARPRLVILDEPATGLAAHEVLALAALLRRLKRLGLTLLVIEHNVPFVMSVADRVTVLNEGRVLIEGEPALVQASSEVREAYFGTLEAAGE